PYRHTAESQSIPGRLDMAQEGMAQEDMAQEDMAQEDMAQDQALEEPVQADRESAVWVLEDKV
ncbi:MAG: hypothetical protein JAY99_06350, partial [Candidatus Thiodiazotropha lotti]|nr:hypothetical protein [Candidatus Thiodiazotropha lotti]MCW4190891.1 hypothetical protein [Candidatus Thiodiazotropha weberae]